ncbi:MAG TPA: dephospho-CoA kinase [Gemmatimonadales bacterium]
MLNVGLTGNVASGKSTVARWFADWGATVIDADQLVRKAQAPGTETLRQIAQRFGKAMLLPNGALDRERLRAKVLADPAALETLNGLVHPAVAIARTQALDAARKRGDRVVVQDIPLLFEVLDPASFDYVVLVDAPAELRRQRLVTSRGMSGREADALIGAQQPSMDKRARSHAVLDNTSSLADLENKARTLWQELWRRSATNA